MQLVPISTIEEVELALLSMRIAWQSNELARLQSRLAPLEQAYTEFERRVSSRVGELIIERNRLRDTCNELEDYTTRLHARNVADPERHLGALFSPEELESMATLCGVDISHWMDEEDTAAYANDRREKVDPPSERRRAPHLKHDDAHELRALYRQLARQFHPDLSIDPGDRRLREEVMLRINDAWNTRDLVTMRRIGIDVKDVYAGGSLTPRLVALRQELTRLRTQCNAVSNRIADLRASKTAALWHDVSLATASIARHRLRLRREIMVLEERYAVALEEFKQALGVYAGVS